MDEFCPATAQLTLLCKRRETGKDENRNTAARGIVNGGSETFNATSTQYHSREVVELGGVTLCPDVNMHNNSLRFSSDLRHSVGCG